MAKGVDFFKIGQVSAGAQADIVGSVGKGLELGLGVLQKLENDRKKADAEIAGVLNTIGDDYDPSLFQIDAVRNTLTGALQNSKVEAAKLIQERQNLSPTDERYTELTSQINSIRGSFDRLNKNAQGYNAIAKQYAELRKSKQLSTAMSGEMAQDLDAILLKGQFNVKDDGKGNLTYIANGREYTQEQLDDFTMPNYELATSYAGQIDGIEKYSQSTGKEIKEGDTQYTKLALGLGNLLNNYSDQELRSAGLDGFIGNTPLFLSTPEEKAAMLTATGPELKAFVQGKLMDNYLNISSEAAKLYQAPPPEFNKPTEGDKKYARNTDNIIAAAEQMYLNGKLPDTLPGLTEIPINSREYVINSQIDAQNKAIAKGDLLKNDALTKEELESQYTAPYYTLDLRPIKSIRQAINIAYGADDNQIKSALSALSSLEEYDASKLLFSTQPNLDTPEDTSEDPIKLPPPPDKKTEITQTIQLRGKYAYAKNYLDDMKKLIEEANAYRKIRSRSGRDYKPKDKEERNQKIEQIKAFEAALKREFPNLDLSNIQIPK